MAVPAAADVDSWIATQPERYRAALQAGQDDPVFATYRDQCPADVYRTPEQDTSGTRDCTDRPGWCMALCRAGQAKACFGLARAVEIELDVDGQANVKFPFFMAACAAGDANGCTNAGATAKKGNWIQNTRPDAAATSHCQVRTYETACDAKAPWGCFMLGMEYESSGAESGKTRDALERACDVDPDGSACDAARARLGQLSE
ncbi:hypothetical protein ACSQ76_20885 [Roseovarius sp. B08]|uniref:hypothetical protein n=1 Tax=Roseovarius sp. B08 TaxID=3449223 RepID=UPI003EDBA0BE